MPAPPSSKTRRPRSRRSMRRAPPRSIAATGAPPIDAFSKLAALKGDRADAALYWRPTRSTRAGSGTTRCGRSPTLRSVYPQSRWIKDAGALELEIRQASGQSAAVSDEGRRRPEADGARRPDERRPGPRDAHHHADAHRLVVRRREGPRAVRARAERRRRRRARRCCRSRATTRTPARRRRRVHYLGLFGGAESRQALLDVYALVEEPRRSARPC